MLPGIVFEYFASKSGLIPKGAYTQLQHEEAFLAMNSGLVPYWNYSLFEHASQFFADRSGLTPRYKYTVNEHINAYYAGLTINPTAWKTELYNWDYSVFSRTYTQRKNLAPNPAFVSGGTTPGSTNGSTTYITGFPGVYTNTAFQWTRTVTGASRLASVAPGLEMPNAGEVIRVRALVYASSTMSGFNVTVRPNVGSGTGATTLFSGTLSSGYNELDLVGNTFTAATVAQSGVAFTQTTSGTIGDVFQLAELIIELGSAQKPWFSGETYNPPNVYKWTGATNASSSTEQVLATTTANPSGLFTANFGANF